MVHLVLGFSRLLLLLELLLELFLVGLQCPVLQMKLLYLGDLFVNRADTLNSITKASVYNSKGSHVCGNQT